MEVDRPDSNFAGAQSSLRRQPCANAQSVEPDLTANTSRRTRLPALVPPPSQPSSPSTTAIPANQNNTFATSSQDVHYAVNDATSSVRSPVISTIGQSSPFEAPIASFTPTLTQHDLKHPIRRPRTTQFFQSSKDLTAHYGIPQHLPPAPSTSRHQPPPPAPKHQTPFTDFATLSQNYINMLANKPADPVANSETVPMPTTISLAELNAPVVPSVSEADQLSEIAAYLGIVTTLDFSMTMTHIATATASSPEFRDLSDFMTSPMPGLEDDFGVSPLETPYDSFLDTPLFGPDDALIGSPDETMLSLFPEFNVTDKAEEPSAAPAPKTIEAPYTISPFSPSLESFDNPHAFPTSIHPSATTLANPSAPSTIAPAPAPGRRSKATGIRKGITVDALLDESAPTQPRKYLTPSSTSKKDVPATFARKRARSAAFGDEEDQLDDIPLDASERDLIEQKRLKNTLAARKSRRRKLELYQNLEKAREEEKQLKEVWKERALVMLATLREHGVNYPDFPEDVQHFGHV